MGSCLNLFNIYPFEHTNYFKCILLTCIKNLHKCYCAILFKIVYFKIIVDVHIMLVSGIKPSD